MNRQAIALLSGLIVVIGSLVLFDHPVSALVTMSPSVPSQLEVPPPPGRKGPDPQGWARLDLPYTFGPGVVWMKIQPGRRIEDIMRRYNLPGPARQLWEPPINVIASQIGLDRWYEVGVPRGREKEIVQQLSPKFSPARVTDFVYVHIVRKWPLLLPGTRTTGRASPVPALTRRLCRFARSARIRTIRPARNAGWCRRTDVVGRYAGQPIKVPKSSICHTPLTSTCSSRTSPSSTHGAAERSPYRRQGTTA